MKSGAEGWRPAEPARHEVRVDAGTEAALAAAEQVIDDWGGSWSAVADGARVSIPYVAGLRRGELRGRLAAQREAGGSRVSLAVEEETLAVQPIPVMILLCAGLGCLLVLAWPFVPALTPLIPVAVVLALVGWFLVVARLSNAGPEELLGEIAEAALARPSHQPPAAKA